MQDMLIINPYNLLSPTQDPGASEMPSDNYKRSQSLQDLAPKTSPNVRLCREISVPLNIAMTTDKTIPEAHKEDSSDSSHGQMDSSSSLNTLTEGDPLSPKSDVFEDQGDSGTEDDSSSSQKGPARRVQSFSDDVQSDSSIPGPSPMEMQGPRRLKNASLQRERRTQQLTSSRIRKSSVPAHFWHQKSSEDVNRKVLLFNVLGCVVMGLAYLSHVTSREIIMYLFKISANAFVPSNVYCSGDIIEGFVLILSAETYLYPENFNQKLRVSRVPV